jgi:hypothetical protein
MGPAPMVQTPRKSESYLLTYRTELILTFIFFFIFIKLQELGSLSENTLYGTEHQLFGIIFGRGQYDRE